MINDDVSNKFNEVEHLRREELTLIKIEIIDRERDIESRNIEVRDIDVIYL